MPGFTQKRKLKTIANDAVREYWPLIKAPLSELCEGRLKDEKVLLTESGLVIHIDDSPNSLGDKLFSKDVWLEMTSGEHGIELHLWNSEGVITPRVLLFTARQVIGNAHQILTEVADNPGGIQCLLLHEMSDGTRGLKAFPSSPEVKRMVCRELSIACATTDDSASRIVNQIPTLNVKNA